MPDDIDARKLKAITDELVAAISSPGFVAAMKKMKQTPMEERLTYASRNLTPSVLSRKGVKLPKGMRVTSRYFEPGSPDIIEVTDHGASLVHVSTMPVAGAWACACGGGLTVCGGAGGGS